MIMSDLKITYIQSPLHWENAEANLDLFNEHLGKIEGETDLIVFPEMFNTGFTMNVKEASETMQGETIKWMAEKAKSMNSVVTGSLIIEEEGKYYNRLIWMRPNGRHEQYDKRHLFRMADEHKDFDYGSERLIVELNGWRICPLICYDLRFPVWSRNVDFTKEHKNVEMGNEPVYDCLLYIANWPEARNSAWKSLLPARAIENQAYVLGLNRIGKDGKDISYSGDSIAFDPYGRAINEAKPHEEMVETITLSKQLLADFRKKFPVAMDGDQFKIPSAE